MMKYFGLMSLFLVGCATQGPLAHNESRVPTSEVFKCEIHQKLSNTDYSFKFIPEDNVLLVNDERIDLIESDFSEGGFVYRSSKASPKWDLKLTFTSYQVNPVMNILLLKSPLFTGPQNLRNPCSTPNE